MVFEYLVDYQLFGLIIQIQQMDIEYECTPPKKTKRDLDFSTPNHKTNPKDTQTPKKTRVKFQSPQAYQNLQILSTPPRRNQNPESKKLTKKRKTSPQTPCKSPVNQLMDNQQISPFWLPRIQSDYKFVRTLGSGNFSTVELYESRLTQQLFAIKTTSMSLMSVNEIQALGTLAMFSEKSKNIVKYYCSWIEQGKIYIAMEYCESSLKEVFLQTKNHAKKIDEQKLKQILRESLVGLKCMHEHNMVHLDIKPDNLLIRNGQVKIADLGLCRITRIKRWTDLDEGDSRYLAREVLNYNQGVDLRKSDIYSLGMSIFQGAILQDLPNNGQNWLRIRQQGINFKQIPQMLLYSPEFQEVIGQMLQPNWQDRPCCEKLLNHKFFTEQKSKRLSRFMRVTGKQSRKMEGSL